MNLQKHSCGRTNHKLVLFVACGVVQHTLEKEEKPRHPNICASNASANGRRYLKLQSSGTCCLPVGVLAPSMLLSSRRTRYFEHRKTVHGGEVPVWNCLSPDADLSDQEPSISPDAHQSNQEPFNYLQFPVPCLCFSQVYLPDKYQNQQCCSWKW